MDLQLTGKTALVTGSNRGTGELIGKTLACEGARVIFHSNEQEAAKPVSNSVPNSCSVWGDLSTEKGADQVVDQVAAIGEVDILVNNYGTASKGYWESSSESDWLDMYQKNVLSAVRLIQAFTPAMKAKSWGRIIQLGTIGSHKPNAIMPHYYAAKGALATISVSLCQQLSHTGITVNTISPGLIHTAEVESSFRHRAKKHGWGDNWDDIVKQVVDKDYPNPSGRIAQRQEVADLVVFIASPNAGFINGQNIRIDGGAVCYV